MRRLSACSVVIACSVVTALAQTGRNSDPKPSAALILSLKDVAGFSGGQDLALDADGNLFVRMAGHNPQHTESRFWEQRYYAKLPPAELSALIAFVKSSGIARYRQRQRYGVPDEALPNIVVALPGGKPIDAAKWANDKDSNFDTLYSRLLDLVAKTAKTPPYRQQPYDYQAPFP